MADDRVAPQAAADAKVRCDACPVTCFIKPGMLGACDRYGNRNGELVRVDPHLLVPGFGIYAGAAEGKRAAISIGVNPHYGGTERRIEAYLLDWEGDLYGDRLVLELWRKLRDERAFESEADLVAQIARDVEETRAADRPG